MRYLLIFCPWMTFNQIDMRSGRVLIIQSNKRRSAYGGECRSHSLRLYFAKKDNTEIENFIDVAGRIKIALEQFRPIHVSFDKISFDGARASSQLWRTNQILADSAAATVWTAPIAGNQLASSQIWTTGPFSATVTI